MKISWVPWLCSTQDFHNSLGLYDNGFIRLVPFVKYVMYSQYEVLIVKSVQITCLLSDIFSSTKGELKRRCWYIVLKFPLRFTFFFDKMKSFTFCISASYSWKCDLSVMSWWFHLLVWDLFHFQISYNK